MVTTIHSRLPPPCIINSFKRRPWDLLESLYLGRVPFALFLAVLGSVYGLAGTGPSSFRDTRYWGPRFLVQVLAEALRCVRRYRE